MKIEEVEKMDEKHFRKGFDTHLNEEYRKQLASGEPEFTIGHQVTSTKDADEMTYLLSYRRDDEKGEVYLNTIHASLKSNDFEGVREHTFTDASMITAGEMQRMLKYGEKVSVYKSLFNKENQPYNAWLSINVNGAKNDYGDYPANSYHDNYFKKEPFVIAEELKRLTVPVKEAEMPAEIEKMEKVFKKANLYEATILHNGAEAKGFLSVNPGQRRIDVLDGNLQLIEQRQVSKALPSQQQSTTPAPTQGDEKKKFQQQQPKVNWTKSPNRGISR
jgi:hypothetical protein